MANKKYIDENFDLGGLVEIGFLENKTDYDYIEKRLLKWFNLSYIQQYDSILSEKPKKLIPNIETFSEN